MRSVIAVVVGYTLWTALWLGGNALFLGEAAAKVQAGELYDETAPLVGALALSVVCSLVAGFSCATIATRESRGKAVAVCAFLLLATGIGVQVSAWALMPVWYHLVFLVLLLPLVLIGGKLAPAR